MKNNFNPWGGPILQPWLNHDDFLLRVDQLLTISVLDITLGSPPASPTESDAYIVATGASGDWAGESNNLAFYSNGGWVFHTLVAGAMIWNVADNKYYNWNGTDIGELNIARV